MNKKLILASRNDGLGERLRAILNALYICKHLGFKFGFVWYPLRAYADEISSNKLAPVIVPEQEEIFSKEFIKKYSYNGVFKDSVDEFGKFKRKNLQSLITTPASNPPYRVTQKRLDTIFKDIDGKEYKMSLIKIWEELDFSDKVKQILSRAKQKVSEWEGEGFSVLHIRAGDTIFSEACQRQIIRANIYKRALAFPLAIELIFEELSKNRQIIVFSDDLSLLEYFKKELPALLNLTSGQKSKLLFSSELCDEKRDYVYKALYENTIMSWADKIYYTKLSGYANLAVLTGKYKEDVDVYDYFTKEQQYNIIKKYISLPYIHNFQKSFACFQAFRLSKSLKMSLEISKFWLKEALEYNKNNDAFHILWIEILFLENKIEEVENYLGQIFKQRQGSFMKTLFYDGFERYDYDFIFKPFLQNAKAEFKNISYIAYQIASNLGFLEYLKDLKYEDKIVSIKTKNQLGAEFIMKNHLSYQLGQAMVENSYSLKGILKNPLDMFRIYLCFKRQKFQHPLPLCEYKDYARAVKFVENHVFYRLGFALIKAQKSWCKGGYFYFLWELRKIYIEYKQERRKSKREA